MKTLLLRVFLLLGLCLSEATGETSAPALTPMIVTVTGNVRAPGPVPWTPEMKLTSAIKRAGGIGWETGSSVIEIRRGAERIYVKLRDLSKKPETVPVLKPGDVVIVDRD
jgi:protein involved in polysaccharide export with SLBB domain